MLPYGKSPTDKLYVKWDKPSDSSIMLKYNITLYPKLPTNVMSLVKSVDQNYSVVFDNLVPGKSYNATVQSISYHVNSSTTYSEVSNFSNNQRTGGVFNIFTLHQLILNLEILKCWLMHLKLVFIVFCIFCMK